MSRLRALIVGATIAGAIGLSLLAIALDRMLWPFSNYPMYSGLAGPTTAVTRAVGLGRDGRERPLPPEIEPAGLLLHLTVDHARGARDARERLARIAAAMGAEYERLRAAGEIRDPPLTAVRIYRDTVQLGTQPHVRRATLVTQAPSP